MRKIDQTLLHKVIQHINLGAEVCIDCFKGLISKVHPPERPVLQQPFPLLLLCKSKMNTMKRAWMALLSQEEIEDETIGWTGRKLKYDEVA